jgi:hypothetical protein
MSRAIRSIAVACCVLAGCREADQPPAAAAAGDTVVADSVFRPDETQVNLPTDSIYHTLTSYDWYARGEPLVHSGRPYEPDGMPVNASLTEMTKVGDYQGVEFYTRSGESAAAVYVPVFVGYWQRFLADPSAAAYPADAADSVDGDGAPADSTAASD